MLKSYRKNLPIFQFHSLQKFSDEVDHAVLSRLGGASQSPFESLNISFTVDDKAENVHKNRAKVCDAFDISGDRLIAANQIHSKNVKIIDEQALQARDSYQATHENQ